eukprot:COSAG01_NODE_92_length_27199_cov_100.594649_14_plen_33_part_00
MLLPERARRGAAGVYVRVRGATAMAVSTAALC